MRALVVDDSRAMRRIVGRILGDAGFEVLEAGDGQQAIDVLEAQADVPELACVDWNMPVMDGLTFITEVRKRPEWRSITLMMVTTESEQDRIVRALAAGAHEYLIKPFTGEAMRGEARPARAAPDPRWRPVMTVGIAPDQALVHAAFEQVWGSMLFTAIEPWPEGTVPELGSGVQAQIELRGDWNGRIVLTCDTEVATQIAGAMLGAPAEEIIPDEDVNDAVGEVLNVVGGSVKGALGGAMVARPARGDAQHHPAVPRPLPGHLLARRPRLRRGRARRGLTSHDCKQEKSRRKEQRHHEDPHR